MFASAASWLPGVLLHFQTYRQSLFILKRTDEKNGCSDFQASLSIISYLVLNIPGAGLPPAVVDALKQWEKHPAQAR